MSNQQPGGILAGGLFNRAIDAEALEQLRAGLARAGFAGDALVETEAMLDEMRRLHEQELRLFERMTRMSGVWRGLQVGDAELHSSLAVWRVANRHVIVQRGESAHCTHCDKHFGWFCPDSPDGTCYYFTDDGKIHLLGGDKVDPKPGHDARFESTDTCLFCGNPEERK